jgi:hypothetical protein
MANSLRSIHPQDDDWSQAQREQLCPPGTRWAFQPRLRLIRNGTQRLRRGGGSDGLRSHARTTATGVVLIGLPPVRRTVGASGRASCSRERPRQLSAEERSAVRSLAHTKSLRSLAADFGVSHETVRGVIRDEVADVA